MCFCSHVHRAQEPPASPLGAIRKLDWLSLRADTIYDIPPGASYAYTKYDMLIIARTAASAPAAASE